MRPISATIKKDDIVEWVTVVAIKLDNLSVPLAVIIDSEQKMKTVFLNRLSNCYLMDK